MSKYSTSLLTVVLEEQAHLDGQSCNKYQYIDTTISKTASPTLRLYLPITLMQIVKAFGVRLLPNVGFEDDEVLASSLLS